MVLYDVYSEADPEFQDPSLPPKGGGIQASDFQELLDKIGVRINQAKVLIDRKYAIPVTSANSERLSLQDILSARVSAMGGLKLCHLQYV